MQPEFEKKLQSLQLPASFMVSDGFLWWTLESATKFNFPRLAFYGMGQYASSVGRAVAVDKLLFGPELEDELITVTQFPWIKVTKNDFGPVFTKPGDNAPAMELLMDQVISSSNSYGQLVNTFYEMEKNSLIGGNEKTGSRFGVSDHCVWLNLNQNRPRLNHLGLSG